MTIAEYMSEEKIFGRMNDEGNVDLLDSDGCALMRVSEPCPLFYVVDSSMSAYHEHYTGLVITPEQARNFEIEID